MFAFLFEIVYNETILHGSDMLYAESGNLFDYSTTSNLRLHTKMCSYPRLPDGTWRSKKIVPLPLVGTVRAGAPITAEECVEDVYPFAAEFIGDDDCFMLTVRGDSMKDAGILEGDLLIVRQQSMARNGQIVIALSLIIFAYNLKTMTMNRLLHETVNYWVSSSASSGPIKECKKL